MQANTCIKLLLGKRQGALIRARAFIRINKVLYFHRQEDVLETGDKLGNFKDCNSVLIYLILLKIKRLKSNAISTVHRSQDLSTRCSQATNNTVYIRCLKKIARHIINRCLQTHVPFRG